MAQAAKSNSKTPTSVSFSVDCVPSSGDGILGEEGGGREKGAG